MLFFIIFPALEEIKLGDDRNSPIFQRDCDTHVYTDKENVDLEAQRCVDSLAVFELLCGMCCATPFYSCLNQEGKEFYKTTCFELILPNLCCPCYWMTSRWRRCRFGGRDIESE